MCAMLYVCTYACTKLTAISMITKTCVYHNTSEPNILA